jgi:hypothetical protein
MSDTSPQPSDELAADLIGQVARRLACLAAGVDLDHAHLRTVSAR